MRLTPADRGRNAQAEKVGLREERDQFRLKGPPALAQRRELGRPDGDPLCGLDW